MKKKNTLTPPQAAYKRMYQISDVNMEKFIHDHGV